MKSQDTEV